MIALGNGHYPDKTVAHNLIHVDTPIRVLSSSHKLLVPRVELLLSAPTCSWCRTLSSILLVTRVNKILSSYYMNTSLSVCYSTRVLVPKILTVSTTTTN